MRVSGKPVFDEAVNRHPNLKGPLSAWHGLVSKAKWRNFAELRADMPATDYVEGKFVFNIKGNNYRLVAKIDFQRQRVMIRWFGTHAEYDRLNIGEV